MNNLILYTSDSTADCLINTITIAGHTFPLTLDRLYAAEYRAQGKRYPTPRKRKSKARMARKWRTYGAK